MLTPTSRYASAGTTTLTTAGGAVVVYLERRFLPQPGSLAQIGTHTVMTGDRLDLIASAEIGDPSQWWQIADANRAMWPEDLTATAGAVLRITLPRGVPGVPGA
jgi:nucleoid-associated protein YgaU